MNFTVGSVGADFVNWKATNDYFRANPLTEDTDLVQIDDTVDNVSWTGLGIVTMNNHTLKITVRDDLWHKGDPTAGLITTLGANVSFFWWGNNSGTIIIERLNIDASALSAALRSAIGSTANIPYNIIRDNIVKGNVHSTQGCNGTGIFGFDSTYLQMYNNKFYNCYVGAALGYLGGDPGGPWLNRKIIENNTAHNCAIGCYVYGQLGNFGYNYILRNNVAVVSSVDDFQEPALGAGGNLYYNCADSDGSLAAVVGAISNCLLNRIPADEFASLNPAESNYLFLKNGSIDLSASRSPTGNLAVKQKCKFTPSLVFNPGTCTIGIAGIAPTYAGSLDITRKVRPGGDDLYSIGCHEQQYV